MSAKESLARIERLLARHLAAPDAAQFDDGKCWRWETTPFGARLTALPMPAPAPLSDLIGLTAQIRALEQNTKSFLRGREANHALLTGPRGCGKSSVVRGLFAKYARRGLRMIETDADGLATLPALSALVRGRAEKFILYCDDLSFAEISPAFSRVKSGMEGGLSAAGGALLLYATSNRRNVIAERHADNLPPLGADDGDIQPMETVDEKIAFADRFGLWTPFFAPSADEYDDLARHWLQKMRVSPTPALRQEARQFADMRGSRNGRIARQFAVIVAGRRGDA